MRRGVITYLDFNSLYPSVISQYKLPHSKFHFLSEDELEGFTAEYILSLKVDDDYGYFICADVEYPDTLHDEHGELPMLPSRMVAPCSPTNQDKLMPSFNHKESYLSHYLMLQFVVRHGLIIKKIHHVIKFFQSKFAKPFVDRNMARRAEATSKFEKDCIKLDSNGLYGKLDENKAKRTKVHLVSDWITHTRSNSGLRLTSSPFFNSISIFSPDLVAIQMNPKKIIRDRPISAAYSIQELSKLQTYIYLYDHLFKILGRENVQFLYYIVILIQSF